MKIILQQNVLGLPRKIFQICHLTNYYFSTYNPPYQSNHQNQLMQYDSFSPQDFIQSHEYKTKELLLFQNEEFEQSQQDIIKKINDNQQIFKDNESKTIINIQQAISCGKVLARLNRQILSEWLPVQKTLASQSQLIDRDNLAAVYWILAKSNDSELRKQIYNALEQIVILHQASLNNEELSMIIWSCAKNREGSIQFWVILLQYIIIINDKLNQIDVANCCWSLVRIGSRFGRSNNQGTEQSNIQKSIEAVWKAMELNAVQNFEKFLDEHSLSTVVWAFAKDNRGDEFWKKAYKQFSLIFKKLSNQALANCIWAFGKRRQTLQLHLQDQGGKTVFDKKQVQIQNWPKIDVLLVDQLSNDCNASEAMAIAWGMARLEMGSTQFWEAVKNYISRFLARKIKQNNNNNLEAQSKENQNNIKEEMNTLSACIYMLSNLSFRYQTHSQQNSLTEEWKQALILLQQYSSFLELSHVTTAISALASKSQGGPEVWAALEKKVLQYLRTIDDSKTITIILHGFALRGQGSKQFFLLMSAKLENNLEKYTLQGLIVCFWALIRSGYLNKFTIENDPEHRGKLLQQFLNNLSQRILSNDGGDQTMNSNLKLGSPDLGMLMLCLAKLQLKNNQQIQIILSHFENIIVQGLRSAFKMMSNNSSLVEEGSPFKIMSQMDLSHTILAYSVHQTGGKEFWLLTERLSSLYLINNSNMQEERQKGRRSNSQVTKAQFLEEENLSIILRVGLQNFSWDFLNNAQQALSLDIISRFSNIAFVNIINCFARARQSESISIQFWSNLEQELQRRISAGLLDLLQFSESINALARASRGSLEFWKFVENQLIQTQSQSEIRQEEKGETKSSSKIKPKYNNYPQQLKQVVGDPDKRNSIYLILQALTKVNALSNTLLDSIFKPLVIDVLKQDFVKIREIFNYSVVMSRAKIADDQIWIYLEKHFLRMIRKINTKQKLSIMTAFAKIKRGSPYFWNSSFTNIEQNLQRIDLNDLLDSIIERQALRGSAKTDLNNEKLQSTSYMTMKQDRFLSIYILKLLQDENDSNNYNQDQFVQHVQNLVRNRQDVSETLTDNQVGKLMQKLRQIKKKNYQDIIQEIENYFVNLSKSNEEIVDNQENNQKKVGRKKKPEIQKGGKKLIEIKPTLSSQADEENNNKVKQSDQDLQKYNI